MTFLWMALTVAVACLGGWPLTAGVLRLAKSHSVRAADAHEIGAGGTPESPAAPVGPPVSDAGPAPEAPAPPDALPAPEAPQAPDVDPPTAPVGDVTAGVLRGGLLIGVLERAAVVLAVLTGQPVAIAYVVAIKGLGRYPELKQAPAASERFIIGTMTSLLWAAAAATVAKVLLL
ncbi:hypothetical protein [Arthrobacter livingstonensis]|uniref:hypothetical protein n=1 Tax=Arthrobacter livingstonensis TaxID=670078 RepID=UPI001474F33A|nr:hypothetical protein [Arthrobacter livingstonensis]